MNECYFLNTPYSTQSETINSDNDICPYCNQNLLLQNRYRIIRYLGGGGFGKTFEVIDTQQNTLKVLKVLILSRFVEASRREAAMRLFQKEARVLKTLTKIGNRGIPQVQEDGYFTIQFEGCTEELPCLVMEKIDGLNLRQWMNNRNNKPIKATRAIGWLKQLIEILDRVHHQHCLHRDIKPENIMLRENGELVLIDFGAVKEQQETYLLQVEHREGTVIGTIGYAPPEQMAGNTKPQSDFFALARTFVYLLTAKQPIDLEYENATSDKFKWQDKVTPSDTFWVDRLQKILRRSLFDLLDNMMEPCWEKRPKDTKDILRRLNKISSNPVRDAATIASSTVVASILIISGFYWYTNGVNGCSRIFLRSFPQGDNISCGEEILGYKPSAEQQKGIDAFAAGNYNDAVNWFSKAWQSQIHTKQKDPQTLIYLNNARIINEKIPSYTIAVVLPLKEDTDSLTVSTEILEGVAQAQDKFNQNQQKKFGLKVLIASDRNDKKSATSIAKSLVEKRDVIGVIGHFSSDTTLEALDVYQNNKLLLISPTATSEKLSNKCEKPQLCFFRRVVNSNSVTAKFLTNYLKVQGNKNRALVFFNPLSKYSSSLQQEFSQNFKANKGKIVDIFEFSTNNSFFNIETANNKIQAHKPNVLVLFPNTDGVMPDQAVQVIREYQDRYLIIGGDSVSSKKIISAIDKNAVGFVMAVPWHFIASRNPDFLKDATQNYWGKNADWNTALSYDATIVFLEAVQKLPSPEREKLPQIMAEPDFQAQEGATGVISFQPNGNRKEENVVLIKVVRDSSTGKLQFTPVVIGH